MLGVEIWAGGFVLRGRTEGEEWGERLCTWGENFRSRGFVLGGVTFWRGWILCWRDLRQRFVLGGGDLSRGVDLYLRDSC